MRIGVPKEIKKQEFRVGLIPASVHELTSSGHQVLIQKQAGEGSGFSDEDYLRCGARIVDDATEIFQLSELIVKVKEPQTTEIALLTERQTLFTYLHLAPDPMQTQGLLNSGVTAIAYETVTDAAGRLPLLAPMSEVAGRMSIQAGARCLERTQLGAGMLLSGVPGVPPATVLILGAGVVGSNAAQMAIGLAANVIVVDRNIDALRRLDSLYGNRLQTVFSTRLTLNELIQQADLVIGAVLIPGATTPRLVSREMLKTMKRGAAIVDVAIDQGGCFETSRPTSHETPTYIEEGIVHYCVANMPGAVPRTASAALNHASLPYVQRLAGLGTTAALQSDPGLLNGLNVCRHQICCDAVALAQGLAAVRPAQALLRA
jgi:alanine dehydrogenase